MGQTTTTTTNNNSPVIFVGTTGTPPTIDGVWQQGEWDNSIEYALSVSYRPVTAVTNRPTIRLVHDSNTLYGIVDVPSDNGQNYINSDGHDEWGGVLLNFYYGSTLNFNNPPGTPPFNIVDLSTNQTRRVGIGVISNTNSTARQAIISHSTAATTLSTTTHSNATHRVWEFSIQLFPFIVRTPLSQSNASIGFGVSVFDSAGNQMLLPNYQHLTISFEENTLPETYSAELMLTVTVLATTLSICQHRRKNII
jgi:hypothetical protein